jgi:hypothetical protein
MQCRTFGCGRAVTTVQQWSLPFLVLTASLVVTFLIDVFVITYTLQQPYIHTQATAFTDLRIRGVLQVIDMEYQWLHCSWRLIYNLGFQHKHQPAHNLGGLPLLAL